MMDNNSYEQVLDTENTYKNERIVARSVSATNKINEWEKSRPNTWVAGAIPSVIAIVILFAPSFMEDYSLRKSLSSFGMQVLAFVCLLLAAFLFYCGQKAQKQYAQAVSEARRKAAKENVVVTDLRIYGSTEKNTFSIPFNEILNSHVTRIENQNTQISDELLRVVSKNETLTFEYVENSTEISNIINAAISCKQNDSAPLNQPENSETYSIRITEYLSLIPSVAAIINLTGMDYVAAKNFLDRLPAVLAENLSKEKAEEFCNELEKSKMKFEIY